MKYFLLSAAWLLGLVVYGQDYKALISVANDNYNQKRFAQSVTLYKQAFRLQQDTYSDFYNAACSAALSGDESLALNWLNLAYVKGYVNIRHMKQDADLNSLHHTSAWKTITAKMQAKVNKLEANYDKALQAQLLTIYDDDQTDRQKINQLGQKYGFESKEVTALWASIEKKDSINLVRVKTILDKYGWVGPDKVGSQANITLFLVIQHADLPTQQKYLPMMRQAVSDKRAEPSALALLEDRVALGEKRRQIYGSQIGEDSTGTSYVLPLADPDNVDKRRAQVGLEPLADYVKQWAIKWNMEAYKKQLPELDKREGIK